MNEKYYKVIEFIKSCDKDLALTQSDISRYTGISKPTIGKYIPLMLARNELDGIVITQKVGGNIILIRK